MPNGRAVLLFRRLSSDNRLKTLNLNQNTKEPLALNPVCCHRDSSLSKRLSTFSHNNLSTQLTRNYSDNIIKMSNSSSESKEKPKYTNRLITEKSPYLLQHAHNPVQWYPWCQEAIDKAKNEDKLIFLSVGYSTCHWCHVMERESFENEEVAAVMNENFVNVKVDREERPDIDRIYMMYLTSTTGRGGWPMSIFITPDLLPVFGGTYFQPEDRPPYPGFKTLMNIIASTWKEKKQQCMENGHEALELLQKMTCLDIGSDSESLKTVPTEETFNKAVERYISNFEPRFGGFNSAPKFPQASIFNFLFHYYARDKTHPQGKKCLDMCLYTLKKIAKGGIHDHIAGGFARYSVDNYWHVPHFEKMLYDQAQLTIAYTDAYLATKDTFFADVVKDIIAYVKQDLRHESGGFYSAEDADSYPTLQSSEKKEGAFYVWEYDEINNLLGDKKINSIAYTDIFCKHFNVKKEGNIPRGSDPHQELTNKNVLIVYGSKEDTAEIFKLSMEQLDQVLLECVNILNQVRTKRPRPHLDSKMLCSWNGLMIAGLAQAGQGLGEKQYVEDAIKTANFIKQYLYDSSTKTLYHSCYRAEDGSVTQTKHPIRGFLDDYAFLIKGLLDLYEASLDLSWLNWARDLQDKQNELFWDSEDGAFFSCTNEDDTVVLRLKDDQDGAEPSGNSVSCHNLQRLAAYADKSRVAEGGDTERRLAQLILFWFAPRLRLAPSSMPEMLSACMFYNDSPTQVLIAGGCSDPRTLELVRAVRARLLPGRVLAVADPSALPDARAAAGMSDLLLSRIRCVGDAPTAYVCRRYACSLPVTDVKQLESILDQVSAKSTK